MNVSKFCKRLSHSLRIHIRYNIILFIHYLGLIISCHSRPHRGLGKGFCFYGLKRSQFGLNRTWRIWPRKISVVSHNTSFRTWPHEGLDHNRPHESSVNNSHHVSLYPTNQWLHIRCRIRPLIELLCVCV